jgi:hypothetical protein
MSRPCPATIYVTVTDVIFLVQRATGATMELPTTRHRTFLTQRGTSVIDHVVRALVRGVRMKGATHDLSEEGDWVRDGEVVGKNYRLDMRKKDDGSLFRRFLFSLCNADLNRNS